MWPHDTFQVQVLEKHYCVIPPRRVGRDLINLCLSGALFSRQYQHRLPSDTVAQETQKNPVSASACMQRTAQRLALGLGVHAFLGPGTEGPGVGKYLHKVRGGNEL